MLGSYDFRLVALSYLVAVLASYTALDLAGRVSAAAGRARLIWLAGGALSLGIGIWAMHFTGMLAFSLPMPINYDLLLVLLSLLAAVAASAVALFTMSRPDARLGYLAVGGPIMGGGIVAMHYTGMAAMRMDATIEYAPPIVLLSVLIAVAASVAALWLAFQFRADQSASKRRLGLKLASALVMGVAITGMHYTGMSAASFAPTTAMAHQPAQSQLPLALAIAGATLVVLGFTLLSALFDRRFAVQAQAIDASTQRFQSLFRHNSDAVFTYSLDGALFEANDAAQHLTGRSLAELSQAGLAAWLTPADAERMARHLQAAAAGALQEYELQLASGGQPVMLSMRNVPIVISGRVVGVYVIATDISARAHALEALQQSDSELRAMLDHQQVLLDTIQQLSTPVLPVHDRVLLVPLIGQMDDARSRQVTQALLAGVERHRARTVIIDITGVPLIDTAVAKHLLQATSAARLLGAESLVVGMTPEVAQTMVGIGISLGAIVTRSTLQDGIAYALRQSA